MGKAEIINQVVSFKWVNFQEHNTWAWSVKKLIRWRCQYLINMELKKMSNWWELLIDESKLTYKEWYFPLI
jgi:hypothetical protein